MAIKINMVALKGVNDDEIPSMIEWAHCRGMDLTLIEVMPMGDIGAASGSISMCRCRCVRARI